MSEEQYRVDAIERKIEGDLEKERQAKLEKKSGLRSKWERKNDEIQFNLRAPKVKKEYVAGVITALREGKYRAKEFLARSIGISYQRGDMNIFTEPYCNLTLFPERNHWLWLPLWLEEGDIEEVVAGLPELPDAISQKDREAKDASLRKQLSEIEKEMEKLGS